LTTNYKYINKHFYGNPDSFNLQILLAGDHKNG